MTEQAALPAGRITLTCRACTLYEHVHGVDEADAWQVAHRRGWRIDSHKLLVCPKCPAVRERVTA